MGNFLLFAVRNKLQIEDRLVDLSFVNLESPHDDRPLPSGTIYTFGKNLQGCDIPNCPKATSWDGHRMIIYNRDAGYWLNLFKQDNTIYYSFGENTAFPAVLQKVPGAQPIQTKQVELSIYPYNQLEIAAYTVPFQPGANIKIFEIVNGLDYEVAFKNYETSKDDVPKIAARSKADTKGQYGQGCDIPDCGSDNRWNGHRMSVTDIPTGGQVFTVNFFKIKGDIYYTRGTEYPTKLTPIPGGFSQGDGQKKVLILNSATDVEMRDLGGSLVTDRATPPPVDAYSCIVYQTTPPRDMAAAGYPDAAAYLNANAQEALRIGPQRGSPWAYVHNAFLPFQNPLHPQRSASWMTELWDYRQTTGGPYVGLRAKWFSNIALPEAHDSMAVDAGGHPINYIAAAQDLSFGRQLLGGIRSFDMRYVDTNAGKNIKPNYVGSHYFEFEDSTMDGCVASLKDFFRDSISSQRCHEFVVLKLRYGTGRNDEVPIHTDDMALELFKTLIDKFEVAGLLGLVLNNQTDASRSPLPYSQLPFTTLEKLNADSTGSGVPSKNLLLSIQPNGLLGMLESKYPGYEKYFWPNFAVETGGTENFNGASSPPFGLSVLGVDVSDKVNKPVDFDYPSRPNSAKLASVAVDSMLYNPGNAFLKNPDLNPGKRVLMPRNDYGGRYNYNFITANFFEDTPFVSSVIQLNVLNDRTDLYALDGNTSFLKIAFEENGAPSVFGIEARNYYGSLQLAQVLQNALRTGTQIEFTVSFDGKFTISTNGPNFQLMPTRLSTDQLGFGSEASQFVGTLTGSTIFPRKNY